MMRSMMKKALGRDPDVMTAGPGSPGTQQADLLCTRTFPTADLFPKKPLDTIQAWSPLQFGMFGGCFIDHPDFPELNAVLAELGEKYGVPKTAVAIAWILRHPAHMQAIAGTMNPSHLADICAASKVNLTHQEWYRLYLASGKFLP